MWDVWGFPLPLLAGLDDCRLLLQLLLHRLYLLPEALQLLPHLPHRLLHLNQPLDGSAQLVVSLLRGGSE